MKKTIRFFLLIPICFLFFTFKSNSQIIIEGPDKLCPGECAIYEVKSLDGWNLWVYQWTVNGNELQLPGPNNPVVICVGQETEYVLEVSGEVPNPVGQPFGFQVDTLIQVTTSLDPLIVSTTALCPDSTAACDKICAFNQATYEVANMPAGTAISWEVLGAQNFTPDGNSVSVEWGAPGQGEVIAIVDGNSDPFDPLQVFCGATDISLIAPTGDAFVAINGGVAPYEITIIDPNVNIVLDSTTNDDLFVPDLPIGVYSVSVTDALGETVNCSFYLGFDPSDCLLYTFPTVINHPSSCADCDGFIDVTGVPNSGSQNFSYLWSHGVTTSFVDNLCPGIYSVTITDLFGCTHSIDIELACQDSVVTCSGESSRCIEILEEPQAHIAATPPIANNTLEICQGQSVFFKNESKSAASYIWDFGDLNTSTQFEPTHTYQIPGNYTVSLIARNACYCSDTSFVNVNVLPAEVPEIKCVGTVCEGESVTYSTVADCSNFVWDISGGGVVLDGGEVGDNFVTVEWLNGPEGALSLTVSGCAGNICMRPNVVPIPIISESAQIQGRTNVCEGSTEEYFIPNYQGTEITWSVIGSGNIEEGQGSERITINWFGNANQGNPQKVIIEFENCYLGCEGKDTLDVNIVPSFYTKGPIEICEKTEAEYGSYNSITNDPMTCDWEVINAVGTVVWTAAGTTTANVDWDMPIGTYTVRATATNAGSFCNDDYDVFVKITAAPPPVSNIGGALEICPDETYSYQANGLPINDFNWSVTGGTPADFKGNPFNVTWGQTPPYEITVTQTATLGLACTSEPTTLVVNEISAFSITGNTQLCAEETEIFSVPFFENIKYEWVITPVDRGTIINGQGTETIEVVWHGQGFATLSVAACGVTENIDVEVFPKPLPEVIHPFELCPFTTASVQTTHPYVSYQWLDEDGNLVSSSPNPDLGAGYYELHIVDQYGCSGQTAFDIFELPEPLAKISVPAYSGICPGGASVTLTASTTSDGYDFAWFENGIPIGINSPFLSVSTAGDYHVVITDQKGCTNNSNTVTITDCASVGGQCVNGFCVGPGGSGGPGTGCNPDGSVSFQIQQTGDCLTRNYLNASVNEIVGSWNWNFGDPASGPDNSSTLENPSHAYSNVGFYRVTFLGMVPDLNSGGTCPYGQIQQDTILAMADFDFKTACPGAPMAFRDISEILPFATLTGWNWNFGDPSSGALNTSTEQHPEHIYATGGTYQVTLTITEASGCQVSITKDITVFDPPDVSFAIPDFTCEKTAIPFQADLSEDVLEIVWDFGDPASGAANSATNELTYHAFDAPGIYAVVLEATDIYGCSNSFSENIAITPNTLSGDIAFSQPSPICEGDNITLIAPTGGIAFEWTTTAATEQITVATSGVYDVTLTNVEGCTYSPDEAVVDVFGEPNGIIQAVEYNEYGQPVGFFDNNYTACEGEDVHLIIQGSLDYSYQWSGGNGTDEEISFTEDRDNLLTVGTHDFTVTITDNITGCTSEEGPFTVNVNPKPDVEISSSPSGFLCENIPATLTVVNPDPSHSYQWNTGEMGISISVIGGGTYFAQAVNQFGCKSRSNEVVINNAPDIDKIPTGCHSRCDPDTMCLPDMPNVASYQWFYNSSPIPAPNGTIAEPIFDQSGDYFVQMIDIYGCKSASDVLTLDLYPGFGDIMGNVYFDVNQNGVIDAADTLVSGINIFLSNGSVNIDTATSSGGSYVFPGILSANYDLILDTLNLPLGWSAVYAAGDLELVGCDVEGSFDWLLTFLCLPVEVYENYEACQGLGIDYNNTVIPAGEVDTFTYLTLLGCDSTVIVTVESIAPDTTQAQLATCTGTTIEYEGVDLAPGDQQDFTLIDVNGCDSIVQVSVDGWPIYSIDLPLSACENSYIEYNGQQLFPGDQQDFLFSTINGCDSVMSITVSSIEEDTTQVQLHACPNETVTYQGVTLSPGDQQSFTLTAIGGCDSVVQVAVSTWPSYTLPLTLTACENSFTQYNGQTFYPGDQQDVALTTINGCDSIMQVTVEAIPVDTTVVSLQVCQGETIAYNGQQLAAGDQISFSLTSIQTDCDSMVEVSVSNYPTVTYQLLAGEICWNSTDGEIEVQDVQGGAAPYLVSLDGNNYQPALSFENLTAGDYTVYLLDDNDCQFEQAIEIPMVPPMIVEATDESIECGEEIVLSPIVISQLPVVWQWSDGTTEPAVTVTNPGTYQFTVSNDCETTEQSITVNLQPSAQEELIYMPNSFSPNDDGINDCYQGYVAPDVEIESYILKIFDRWGNMMFETNDIHGCWNGVHRDKQMQSAVFAWFMEIHVRNCDGKVLDVFREGDVHLIR